MKKILLLLVILLAIPAHSQKLRPFRIVDANGHSVSYRKLLRQAARADAVFFGELHDNAIAHWLEIKLTKDLYERKQGKLILGAEMFETDNAEALNRYLKGQIDRKGLDSTARLWPNFKDYKPMLDFARDHHIPFVATNVPRRYASMVFHGGFHRLDSLPENEKQWMAPLPIPYDSTLSQYRKMRDMMPSHRGANLPKAQALKDATMAYNIAQNMKPGHTFLHFNGSYHSAFHQGILWYLRRLKPQARILTIEVVSAGDVRHLPEKARKTADFIIIVDKDMPSTY